MEQADLVEICRKFSKDKTKIDPCSAVVLSVNAAEELYKTRKAKGHYKRGDQIGITIGLLQQVQTELLKDFREEPDGTYVRK